MGDPRIDRGPAPVHGVDGALSIPLPDDPDRAGLRIVVFELDHDGFGAAEAAIEHERERRRIAGAGESAIGAHAEQGGDLTRVEGAAGREPGVSHVPHVDRALVFVRRDQSDPPHGPTCSPDGAQCLVRRSRRVPLGKPRAKLGNVPTEVPSARGIRRRDAPGRWRRGAGPRPACSGVGGVEAELNLAAS